jgi:hypothetical protein
MFTVPIGSRSSHRPPSDGCAAVVVRVGDGRALLDTDVEGAADGVDALLEADEPPGPAA